MSVGCRAARMPKPWEARAPVATVILTFDRPPSVNKLFRNLAGRGRVKTADYANWIAVAGMQIMAQRPGCVRGHYHLSIVAERSNDAADLNNLDKALSDLLKTMGVIQDDSFEASADRKWHGRGSKIAVRVTSCGAPT